MTGTVVGCANYVDDDQDTRFQAIIYYQVELNIYNGKDPSAGLTPRYDTDEKIDLLYMPGQPDFVVINNSVDLRINCWSIRLGCFHSQVVLREFS